MITLETRHLSKSIKGQVVLDDINIQMDKGNIYGVVGKNGSGKTMLFRCLAGLVYPSSGEILYDGKVLHKDIPNPPSIGIIIENMGLYPEFTGFKNLKYLASIHNRITDNEIKSAISRVGLNPDDKRTIKKYSLGMRQRIILAQAFMEHPSILLLDEPTNGLDEAGVKLVRDILKEEAANGTLIFISSHNKEDITYLCDSIYYMTSGRLEKRV
jgi:ABC-2 type transport system ATP-binding protein